MLTSKPYVREWEMSLYLAYGEVLSVPHIFRAELVGTAWIPIGIQAEILEHSTTQIVGNLSNLSDWIPIGPLGLISDQFPLRTDWFQAVLIGNKSDKSLMLIDHLI